MSDTISRQAAIDAVETKIKKWNAVDGEGYHVGLGLRYTDVIDTLTELPSAQPETSILTVTVNPDSEEIERVARKIKDAPVMVFPSAHPEQRWIPCSERLPEQYGNYLVSIEGEEPDIGTINPNDPRGWSLCDANGFYWASDKMLNVIAWMPLPEPYKGGEKDG